MARKIRVHHIKTVKGKRTLLAEFMLLDSGEITSKILSPKFKRLLNQGLLNRPLRKRIFPEDGEVYMDSLLMQFSGSHTRATEIKG